MLLSLLLLLLLIVVVIVVLYMILSLFGQRKNNRQENLHEVKKNNCLVDLQNKIVIHAYLQIATIEFDLLIP